MKAYSGDAIFVCQTPLHFYLTYMLSREWTGKKAIVWVSESDVDARLLRMVAGVSSFRIFHLPGGARVSSKVLRMLMRSINVLRLRFFQRKLRNQNLVIFNDTSPETQYLIASFHSRGGRVFLAEDGVATYSIGGVVPAGIISRWLGKILYGSWWSPKPKIGLDDRVSAVFASYPKLLRSDVVRAKEVLQIPSLETQYIDSSFDLGLKDYLLCVMPLVSSVTDKELCRFLKAIKLGRKLAIKLHPRETGAGRKCIDEFLAGNDYFYLPREAPVEVLCLSNSGQMAVVGYRSSALHLLKFFRSDLHVMYVEFAPDGEGGGWFDFYRQVGIINFFDNYMFG